jgi:3-methyladenine DNA glycosylase Mpg
VNAEEEQKNKPDEHQGLRLRISAHRDHPFRFIVTARFGRT